MYIAKETFRSKRKTLFLKGQKISNTAYFFLMKEDKEKFKKEEDEKKPSTGDGVPSYRRAGEIETPTFDTTSFTYPIFTHEIAPSYNIPQGQESQVDSTPSFGGYGDGNSGGAGASGSWDSGPSYDSGSSDSGGGCDSGGGDGGGD